LLINRGDKARPVTDPRYIPLYTKARDLLLSETGIHLERMLFIAGIATPCKTIRYKKNNYIKAKSYCMLLLQLETWVVNKATPLIISTN